MSSNANNIILWVYIVALVFAMLRLFELPFVTPKFVGSDPMGNITKHQVLLNYELGNNALGINFRLPSGLSNKITFDVNTGKADLGSGFIPTLPEARITWDDRWSNCMSKRVPDGPVSGVRWVLSGNIFLDLGDCIGSASGWW